MSQTSQRSLTWSLIVIGLLISDLALAVWQPSQLSDPSRRWSVDMGISQGYDDNINSSSANKQESSTTTLNPRLFLNIPLDQTFIGLRYSYNWTSYWERIGDEDQSHSADLIFSHRFNPRLQLDVTDNFSHSIYPDIRTITGSLLQYEFNYSYNNLAATLTYNLTRLWTLSINNSWQSWSYDSRGPSEQDRNIYTPGFNVNYLLSPATTVGIGFNVGIVDYRTQGTSTNQLNSTTETAYLFLSHMFNPQLSGQLSAGGSASELDDGHSTASPYFSGSMAYRYAPNGTVAIGGSYFLYTSDLNGYRNSEAMSAFLQFSHAITQKLTARVAVNFTRYELQEPDYTISSSIPNPAFDAYLINISATYAFTRWLYGEANYQFTEASSNVSPSFDRNRLWFGLRVTY